MNSAFFVASKILWAVVVPETLLILLFLIGFIALVQRRQTLAVALIGSGLCIIFAIGIFPLGNLLLVPLEATYPANPPLHDVAGIIVLGGGSDPDIAARWNQPALNDAGDRYVAGAILARRFPAAHVYLSGGSGRLTGDRRGEAAGARQLMIDLGVDPGRLVTEEASRTTAENAQLLRIKVPRPAPGAWVLITSAFHMPRAMASFCAAGWKGLIPYPTDYRTAQFGDGVTWKFAEHLAVIDFAAKERMGLIAYRLTGRAAQSC